MPDEVKAKPARPTWAYRRNKRSGEVESRLFEDVTDIPKNGGWQDRPPAAPAEAEPTEEAT